MIEKNNNRYKAVLKVQNKVGVLARISIILRKFNVNIHSIKVEVLEKEEFFNVHLLLDTSKNKRSFSIVMKKLERLIPVISVNYNEA